MKYDIVLAGVGGQGVLSISAVIATAAMQEGLHVKQSEVHGMAQRGGAVSANLRLADAPVESDLIPRGAARLILSMEPLESLRYLPWLAPDGAVVTSTRPMVNIADYPDLEGLLGKIRALPNATLIDAEKLAKDQGSVQAVNMVMVGAASHRLPVKVETLELFIERTFARKGRPVVEVNLRAFRAGRAAAQSAVRESGG